MHQASPPVQQDPTTASLATIGMRIRKAVADGYRGTTDHQYSLQHQFQQEQQQAPRLFARVPLPLSMEQPPSLTNMGLTIDSSCLNMEEWDSKYAIHNAPISRLDVDIRGSKRKHDAGNDGALNFEAKYGLLSFNEDF